MMFWPSVFGLSPISHVDEGDHPEDVIDFAGDGSENTPFPRFEFYGDIVTPPQDTSAIYFKLGAGGIQMPWGTIYQGRPSGLGKAGTRALYCDAGSWLALHGSGATAPGKIEARTAQNADITLDADGTGVVQVNGGTAKVAREGDPCKIAGALATWMAQVETALNVLSPGAVAPLSPTFLSAPGITINGGADRFKG